MSCIFAFLYVGVCIGIGRPPNYVLGGRNMDQKAFPDLCLRPQAWCVRGVLPVGESADHPSDDHLNPQDPQVIIPDIIYDGHES